MARQYKSVVREEKANRTREALLKACEALVLEAPFEDVTIPALAERAGVTKPTAYSYFPDRDALLAAFLNHMRGRLGLDHETIAGIVPERLPHAVRDNHRRFNQNARVLMRVMDSPGYERVRLSRKLDRAGAVLPQWLGVASEGTLRKRLGPIYLLTSPASWRWLRETWGLSEEDAAAASAWAIGTLVAAMAPADPNSKTQKKKEKQR